MEHRYDGIVNLINAQAIAHSKGISLSTVHDPDLSHVKNLVSVRVESATGEAWELTGYTDIQGGQRLTKVNKFHVDVLLDGPLILVINADVPGVVGEVGTLLGSLNINIAEYSLSRQTGDALSLIKCDSVPDPTLIEKLKSINSVRECYFLA